MTRKRTIRVCIVEDETTIRETLSALLAGEELLEPIGAFATGEAAMKELPALAPDAVIMDIGLPGMSGIECLRSLVPSMPDTQFLMFTMHDDDERVFEALKAGAHGYLLKGGSSAQIVAALHDLMDGGAPMSASVARRVIGHFRTTASAPDPALGTLTEREREVLRLLADGLLYKEVADHMGISVNTVAQHVHRMYGKLHVQNRTEAVNKFFGR